jgi:DNA polymerase IV
VILHVDLDQFIAAVELQHRPELRGRRVIVGGSGDPSTRGVVATASYEARRFGIDSGMPLRTAAHRCPDAVFLAFDRPAYQAASSEVMAVLAGFPWTLEVAGWDEAYLELNGDAPERVAADVQRAVLGRTGLSCSVGIGENKLQAKVASALAKPGGICRLGSENWTSVMDQRPADTLPGIGPKRKQLLAELGITDVGGLARASEETLCERFGPNIGSWLRQIARGIDETPVRPEHPPVRSLGHQITYQHDLADPVAVELEVTRLAATVAQDLQTAGKLAQSVVVVIRFAPFETHGHIARLGRRSAEESQLTAAALTALERFELDRPVRLVGVRAELVF